MKPLSERSLLLLLAAVQFTHIMDFMIMMPLGPQLMRELHIGPGHFSALVAAYTISSGVGGWGSLPPGRFDRRKGVMPSRGASRGDPGRGALPPPPPPVAPGAGGEGGGFGGFSAPVGFGPLRGGCCGGNGARRVSAS